MQFPRAGPNWETESSVFVSEFCTSKNFTDFTPGMCYFSSKKKKEREKRESLKEGIKEGEKSKTK